MFTNAEADFEVHRASHLLKIDSYHHVGIEISYVLRSPLDDVAEELESP